MFSPRQSGVLLLIFDLIALIVVFMVSAELRGLYVNAWMIEPLLLPAVLLILAIYLIDGYRTHTDMMSLTYTSQHTIAVLAAGVLTLLVTFVFIPPGYQLQSSRAVIALSFILLVPATLGYRRVIYARTLRRSKNHSIVFLGDDEARARFEEDRRRFRFSRNILTVPAHAPVHAGAHEPEESASDDLLDCLHRNKGLIEGVVIHEPSAHFPAATYDELVRLHFSGVPVMTLETFHETYWRKIPLQRLNQVWLFQEGFELAREPVFARLKRLSDLLLAGMALILTAPVWILIPLAIRLEDGGPALFRQTRIGRNRRPFELLKFRSMKVGSEAADPYTQARDGRVTRVGRMLRKMRMDELPQLWNVLCGDMSLIGPRAEWQRLVEEYEKTIPCYHFRHLVKPGITGWAQVNYRYGANQSDTLRKLEYDLYYVRHFSFVLDASIALKTIQVVLFGKGR